MSLTHLSNTNRVFFALLLSGALAFGVYFAGLHGNFFFDDGASILTAEGVRLSEFSFESLRSALLSGKAGLLGRPVAQLSFALNYHFSGFSPFVFKATNLFIHIICSWLVFLLAFSIFSSGNPKTKQHHALIAATVLASAWLLHPIQLLPVLHVVQRMTSLSALFLFAALLLHITGRERGNNLLLLLAWLLFWPLSFLSKETGALFPIFSLVWELIIHRENQGSLDRFARCFTALALFAFAASTLYAIFPTGRWLWAGYSSRDFSLTERLLTEGRVLWLYLGLILLPRLEAFGIYHDDILLSASLFSPWTTLPALLGIFGLAFLAWRTRIRAPVVSFGLVFFLVGHSIESTALPLEIAHEHRNYVPLLGVLLSLAWLFMKSLETTGSKKTLCISLATLALTYLPFITTLRAHQFGEELRRTQIEAQYHQTSARAQFDAGHAFAALPEAVSRQTPAYSFARKHFTLAAELDPKAKMPLLSQIKLNCKASAANEISLINELAYRLYATPFAPGDRNVLYALKELSIAGSICLTRSDIDRLFSSADKNPTVSSPVRAMMHSWHADYLWLREHDLAAAKAALSKSLDLIPGNPSNQLKYAQLMFLSGELEKSKQQLLSLREEVLSAKERETLNHLLISLSATVPTFK